MSKFNQKHRAKALLELKKLEEKKQNKNLATSRYDTCWIFSCHFLSFNELHLNNCISKYFKIVMNNDLSWKYCLFKFNSYTILHNSMYTNITDEKNSGIKGKKIPLLAIQKVNRLHISGNIIAYRDAQCWYEHEFIKPISYFSNINEIILEDLNINYNATYYSSQLDDLTQLINIFFKKILKFKNLNSFSLKGSTFENNKIDFLYNNLYNLEKLKEIKIEHKLCHFIKNIHTLNNIKTLEITENVKIDRLDQVFENIKDFSLHIYNKNGSNDSNDSKEDTITYRNYFEYTNNITKFTLHNHTNNEFSLIPYIHNLKSLECLCLNIHNHITDLTTLEIITRLPKLHTLELNNVYLSKDDENRNIETIKTLCMLIKCSNVQCLILNSWYLPDSCIDIFCANIPKLSLLVTDIHVSLDSDSYTNILSKKTIKTIKKLKEKYNGYIDWNVLSF
jgi:hypothetical protein